MAGSHRFATQLFCGVIILAATAASVHAKPKYYVEVAEVSDRPGVTSNLANLGAENMRAAFKKNSTFIVSEGSFSPPPRLKSYLVKGFIEMYKKTLKPGPPKNSLEITVKVTLLGTTKPGESFGFTAEGDATVTTTQSGAVSESDIAEANADALKDAFTKAVEGSILKLANPPRNAKR